MNVCRSHFLTILGFGLLLAASNLQAAAPFCPTEPLHRRIDALLQGSTKEFVKQRAGLSSDAEFCRRIHLDLIGRIPTAEVVRKFLADKTSGKRSKLIDALLASPEHARHLSYVFDSMLMERLPDRQVPATVWHDFLFKSFLEDKPYDAIAREILSGDDDGSRARHRVKFYLERNTEPNRVARDISRLFLGMNLQCAQCHDHPLIDDYKQEQYYGLFAFLTRSTQVVDRTTRTARLSELATGEVSFQSVFDPRKVTRTTLPRVPGGPALRDPDTKGKPYRVAPGTGIASVPSYSRRARLAESIARVDYLPFRRNLANRLWAQMMGRGLFEPLDRDSSSNLPTHPELLDTLCDELASRKLHIRGFLREIALSEAYQRSSERPDHLGEGEGEGPLYSTALLKPLSPEQLAWSLMEATGLIETQRLSIGPKVTEAAIYSRLSGNVPTFTRTFSGNPGEPQSFDPRMDQALFLANGPTVRSWLVSRPGSLLGRLEKLSGNELADELYLSVFGRLPDAEERKDVSEFLRRRPKGQADLAWGLMASTEFRFNH